MSENELAALEAWVRANGGTVGPVRARARAARGHGLVTTRAVRVGELLLRVPAALILTDESASRSPLGRALRAALPSATPAELVCAALVHERQLGDASAWAAWLRTVPTEYESAPAWGTSELELLGADALGTPLRARVRAEQAALRERHVALRAALHATHGDGAAACALLADGLCWRAFVSAWCAVHSRAASIGRGAGKASGLALVPMGDLFNHRPGAPTSASYVRSECGCAYVGIVSVLHV
ncbi:hypothetical protein KFE25_010768 [Diacronema lutheri]|uniref:SET domain-containing protein n=1 Tax=Diacronema lutheri TaxID=2081491 RepID=A0A8J5X6W3_DIALT|nr:hypothetical protein KFE25_010768 [Diacronema lutheri]